MKLDAFREPYYDHSKVRDKVKIVQILSVRSNRAHFCPHASSEALYHPKGEENDWNATYFWHPGPGEAFG